MDKPLILPILFYAEASAELRDLGVSVADDHEQREMMFLRIDAISEAADGNALIFLGNEVFLTACPYKQAKDAVLKWLQ